MRSNSLWSCSAKHLEAGNILSSVHGGQFYLSYPFSIFQGIPEAALINDLPVETKNVKVNLKWKESQNSGAPITKYTVYQRIVTDGDKSHEWV